MIKNIIVFTCTLKPELDDSFQYKLVCNSISHFGVGTTSCSPSFSLFRGYPLQSYSQTLNLHLTVLWLDLAVHASRNGPFWCCVVKCNVFKDCLLSSY